MCGLCGVFGHIGPKEKAALAQLHIFSQTRGLDSTGVYLLSNDKKDKGTITKRLGGYENLVSWNGELWDVDNWKLIGNNYQLALGHHRKATVGAITEDFAHPFKHKGVVSTHNGTIPTWEFRTDEGFTSEKNDSQLLTQRLGNKGGDPQPVFEDLGGAWAVAWWNKVNHTLNLIRNTQRTLCYAVTADGKTLFWASEGWMIHRALQNVNIKSDNVWLLNPNTYMTFEKGKGGVMKRTFKTITRKTYVAPPVTPNYYRGNTTPTTPYRPPEVRQPVGLPAIVNTPRPVPKSVDTFIHTYAETYQSIYVKRDKFDTLVKNGCGFCKDKMCWEDRADYTWFDSTTPICAGCTDSNKSWLMEPDNKEYVN
jgi:hypothetical protein